MATAKKATTKKKVAAKANVVKKTTSPKPRIITEKEEQEDKEIKELIANAARASEPTTDESVEPKAEGKEDSESSISDTPSAQKQKEDTPESTPEEEITEEVPTQETESEKAERQSSPLVPDTVTIETNRRLWPLLVLFFLIGLIAGGVFFMTQKTLNLSQLLSFSTPTPTPTPTAPPSPTPVEANPTEYKIKVLNGSGVAGEAAKAKESLEKSGFVVSSIGNADDNTHKKTIIQAKKYVSEAFIKKLREKLEETYTVSSELETPDTDDGVVIILGSTKAP